MELSLHSYRKALSRDEIPGVLLRAGVVSQLTGDNKQAIKYFERALELDSTLVYAYPKLIDTYLALGMEKKASEAMSRYQNLKQGQ
jgi:tetratricopeptide (TPR) repeat protein